MTYFLVMLLLFCNTLQGLVPLKMKMNMREKLIISVVDPSTDIIVKLIGTMHYNPASIKKSELLVKTLAEEQILSSVIVESCETRWLKTIERQRKGSIMRNLFDNEMQAASEIADKYDIPTYLGDQNITITTTRMKETFLESIKDICTFQIIKLIADLKRVKDTTISPKPKLPVSSELNYMLHIDDFMDIELLKGLPVALVRYPLAFLTKSPKNILIGLSIIGLSYVNPNVWTVLDTELAPSLDLNYIQETILDFSASFATIILEFLILGRTFLVALLEERNEVIVRRIRQACIEAKNNNKKVVIAVLGAAHVNGISYLIQSNNSTLLL